MPPPTRVSRARVLRGVGFVVAVALAVTAVWLIVTGDTQKRIEIGVLTGLWGSLLGAYALFGSRPRAVPGAAGYAGLPGSGPAHAVAGRPVAGAELDLRASAEIERAAAAAARREFEEQLRVSLEQLVRRELRDSVARELAGLRAEVGALRNELVEKVGGQLRLERTETTRLIGSDLAALQDELRRLREGGGLTGPVEVVHPAVPSVAAVPPGPVAPAPVTAVRAPAAAATPTTTAEAVATPGGRVRADEVTREARVVHEGPVVHEAEVVPEPEVVTEPGVVTGSRTVHEAEIVPDEPARPEPAAARHTGAPATPADPFADLPRLTPFTEFELDPVGAPAPAGEAEPAGRHSDRAAERGRRYRSEDDDDVLARILAREGRG